MTTEAVAPHIVVITLDGRLDMAGAAEVDLQFSAIAGSHIGVVVDLSKVTFLASIGLRTLLLGAKPVQRRGGHFVLLNPIGEVERVLDVSGVTEFMPIHRSKQAALAAVGVPA